MKEVDQGECRERCATQVEQNVQKPQTQEDCVYEELKTDNCGGEALCFCDKHLLSTY